MKEQLITLETAKLAKEKGFNITTKSFYGCDSPAGGGNANALFTVELKKEGVLQSQEGTMVYDAPRQSLLQKWLREKHDINIQMVEYFNLHGLMLGWHCKVYSPVFRCELGESYEESLEKGLQEALKLIK